MRFHLAAECGLMALLLTCAHGCATVDQALYDVSSDVAPTHPVYGTPVFNMVSEKKEIETARTHWLQMEASLAASGTAVDPPSVRRVTTEHVFEQLVSVAHRQQLPWEVHLVETPDANAFTFGGGMVVVLDGLFGGLVGESDKDELASILAHEIAHVTLLHVPTRQTWTSFSSLAVKDARGDYYRAAYSTDQEAEADRIAALYLALAGYDPAAAPRVWARAHQQQGSSAARQGFLHDHPLPAERLQATAAVAVQVGKYRIPGKQNPKWKDILDENVLYTRVEEQPYETGVGFRRAAAAAMGTWAKHEKAMRNMEYRQRMAAALQGVQIVRTWQAATPQGIVIYADVYNRTSGTLAGVALDIEYFSGQALIHTDTSCRIAVRLPPGTTGRLGCLKRAVPGALAVQPRVADAAWR